MTRDVEPVKSHRIVVKHVVRPAELQGDRRIDGVRFVSEGVIPKRVFHEAGVVASFAQNARIERGFGRLAVFQYQWHVQSHARAVGSGGIGVGQHDLQQRHGKLVVVIFQIKQAELRGGEVSRQPSRRSNSWEFVFRVGPKIIARIVFLRHAQQQPCKLAMQSFVFRIDLESFAELVNVRIAVRQALTREFGGTWFASTRGCEQRGDRALGIVTRGLYSREFKQDRFVIRLQSERSMVAVGGEFELASLLGQFGQFVHGAEGGWCVGKHLLPARDALREGAINVLEGLLGSGTDCVVRRRIAPARGQICAALRPCGRERRREPRNKGRRIPRATWRSFEIDAHGLAKLFAGAFAVPGFQQRVGEVFTDIGTRRRKLRGLAEAGNRAVVIVRAQGIEGFRKGLICGIRWLPASSVIAKKRVSGRSTAHSF